MYNKKEIFQNAWAKATNAVHFHGGKKSEYFAECLREQWAFVKMINEGTKQVEEKRSNRPKRVEKSTDEIIAIKDWFVRKNFSEHEAYIINTNDWIEVVEETAKAYHLIVHNADFGNIKTWAPKSCCVA